MSEKGLHYNARELAEKDASLRREAKEIDQQMARLRARKKAITAERVQVIETFQVVQHEEDKIRELGGIPNSDLLGMYHEHACGRAIFGTHCHREGPMQQVEHGWLPWDKHEPLR